ncbi:MAG: hypothetical protein KF708_16465 [Pirellulales bacterium]|nr:hypothetical protein [Pirellulales bacterium]
MTGSSYFFLLLTCCVGGSPSVATSAEHQVTFIRAYQSGSWQVQETEQFQVCVQSGFQEAEKLASVCERLLAETRRDWLSESETAVVWRPKCQIILHPNKNSYLAAVGPGGASTVGSALVERRHGQIISRRIDLLATARDGALSALPHEMTHVVLSDRFVETDPPRWADEGLAVLADPLEKQARHAQELDRAVRGRTLFRLPQLMADAGDACQTRPDVFYAQSTSLVRYLVSHGTRAQFVEFLTMAGQDGYDAALRHVYSIDGVAALEKGWHRVVTTGGTRPAVDALVEDEAETLAAQKRS